MQVDTKAVIKDYKQCKKDLKLIEKLIKNKKFRAEWCKKNEIGINTLTDKDLEVDYKIQLRFMTILSHYVKE